MKFIQITPLEKFDEQLMQVMNEIQQNKIEAGATEEKMFLVKAILKKQKMGYNIIRQEYNNKSRLVLLHQTA